MSARDGFTPEQRRAILARLDEARAEREVERPSSLPTCDACWNGSHRVASARCQEATT